MGRGSTQAVDITLYAWFKNTGTGESSERVLGAGTRWLHTCLHVYALAIVCARHCSCIPHNTCQRQEA